MKISEDDVIRIAQLARIAVSPEEVKHYTKELGAILEAFEMLSSLDTKEVIPQSHVIPLEMPMRTDKVRPSVSVEKALSNAPKSIDQCFGVPKIVEK